MKKWFLIVLVLALPVTGLATQENTVAVLPAVAPLAMSTAEPAADYSSAPMLDYYYANFYMDKEDYQAPRMTAEERMRAKDLLDDYQAGVRPSENVLNKLEDVVVGVYTLNAEDYEGETLFTLLPVNPLTDDQILQVIDAFARSGQTFDPEALNYKNCMRGGGAGMSRHFVEDERDRLAILRELYVRQGFVSEKPFTPLVTDDGLGMVFVDSEEFCGQTEFIFMPYRRAIDEELLAYIVYTTSGNPADYGNMASYEKQLRLELSDLLGAPIAMMRSNESMGVMGDYNISYGDEKVYYAYFTSLDHVDYSGYLDIDSGKLLTAYAGSADTLFYSDLHLNPFDEKWLEIASQAVLALRDDGMAIQTVESFGEVWLHQAGYGVLVDVTMADGGIYSLKIAFQNEAVYDIISYASHGSDLEKMYGDFALTDND